MPAAAVTPRFRRVALIGKLRSAEIVTSLRSLTQFLEKRGCEVLVEQETAADLGVKGFDYESLGKRAQLAIVIGGDGTMLAAARNLVRYHVPVVGVNQGRVGFMTDIGHEDMFEGVGAILDGNYTLEERALLDAEVRRGASPVLRTLALNEAVLGKGAEARLIEFSLWLDGEFELVVCNTLLDEVQRTLSQPKISGRVASEDALRFIRLLQEVGEVVADPEGPPPVHSDDPGDDYLLALAVRERTPLVSGDAHLLALNDKLPILSPRALLEQLERV